MMRHLPQNSASTPGFDPRLKLAVAAAVLAMAVSSTGVLFPAAVFLTAVAAVLARGMRLRTLLLRFAEPLAIASVLFAVKALTTGTSVAASARIFGMDLSLYREGMLQGAVIASRVGAAVSVVSLLTFTTSFTELMAACSWYRVPRTFVDICVFAWRYLFLLLDDAQVVYSSQKIRLGYSGCRRSLRSMGTLAGALVIKAFDGSRTMTSAMARRGYDGTLPLLEHRPLRLAEVAVSCSLVAVLGMMWRLL